MELSAVVALFWYTIFLYPLTTTLSQSPLPSHSRSWLPSTNPPCFTLASLHFPYSSSFSPLLFPSFPIPIFHPPLPTPHIYAYNMPIQLSYIGLYCTISSCTDFATRNAVMLIQLPRVMQYNNSSDKLLHYRCQRSTCLLGGTKIKPAQHKVCLLWVWLVVPQLRGLCGHTVPTVTPQDLCFLQPQLPLTMMPFVDCSHDDDTILSSAAYRCFTFY